MKKAFFTLALMLVAFTANAQSYQNGDMNHDGEKSITDVIILVDQVLNDSEPPSYLTCPDDNHPHMIDLGLSSGTKWSCCNVGADKPETTGDYYSWGETKAREGEDWIYDWENYIHCDGSENTCHNLGSDIADTQYDVAHVKWGRFWSMPSKDQFKELEEDCSYTWTTMNGVDGGLFTGPSGGTIFLPASGLRRFWSLFDDGSWGSYWSSTPNTSDIGFACILTFFSLYPLTTERWRCDGLNVRPVMSRTQNIDPNGDMNQDSKKNITDVIILIEQILKGSGAQAYLTCPDDHHPHKIDLGLPSGTKWACCNVADDPTKQSPTSYGGYYAWGETDEKAVYYIDTYQYYDSTSGYQNLGNIAGTEYDVAHVKWGGSWVMPSYDQIMDLMNNCTYEWTTMNGVHGGKFTSKINGGSIFLPAAGNCYFKNAVEAGSSGYYWSSTPNQDFSTYTDLIQFNSGSTRMVYGYFNYSGLSVRPISYY